MSNSSKALIGVIIVVVIILGVWWWMSSQNNAGSPAAINQTGNTEMGTSTSAAPATTTSGDSDQSINQEMASINGQMNGFSSDSASINQGLNDQPVQQSQPY